MIDGDERRRRAWGPRLLAPLAFFAAATVLVVIVNSALNNGSEAATQPPPPPSDVATEPEATGTAEGNGGGGGGEGGERQFHRIRAGDTLDAIAARYDTTVDDLLQLNPNIQPNNLTPGQRIRVR